MPSVSLLNCFSHSDRSEEQLPVYIVPYKRGPFQVESPARQEKTILRIQELAKQSTKAGSLVDDKDNILLTKSYLWSLIQPMDLKTDMKDNTAMHLYNENRCFKRTKVNSRGSDAVDDIKLTVAPTSSAPRLAIVSMEGRLLKFTNIIKGYQYRWVVLNADAGILEYFGKKDHKKLKPRGRINLQAAKVSKSQSDSKTFIVSAADGNTFKLKANNDKEGQVWIERITTIANHHTGKLSESSLWVSKAVISQGCGSECFRKAKKETIMPGNFSMKTDAFLNARKFYKDAEDFFRYLDNVILAMPTFGINMNFLDADLLMLKATSSATLQCIEDCISLLQLAKLQLNQCTSANSSLIWKHSNSLVVSPSMFDATVTSLPNPEDEIPDDTVYEENNTEKMDDHRSIILHLLSQLKIGMDLTKVTLPTFILERRSLLELFTDCMSHPDAFVKITKINNPKGRFLATLEWYLTSFHCGKLGTSAKKPYNPIIGEVFHCSWHVPDRFSKDILLTYTAEQVSHHPPVSAFYVECLQNHIRMNACIHTKSKFMGMSMGVSMIGKVHLRLEDYGEEYVFSMPSAYARSILTVPWVELGDKLQMTCEKTGYMASIIFHTKPFYGGKLHHLTAEAKNAKTGDIICKVCGEWNSKFEFTYPVIDNKEKKSTKEISKIVDVNNLKIYRKYLRPMNMQKSYESRTLWFDVTQALLENDVQRATHHKHKLESIQREKEERQRALNIEYEAKEVKKVKKSNL